MESTNKPIFGYWNFRGRGQSIRLLLTYAGVDFIDKRYSFENKGEQWHKDKWTLGFDFPNLPYLIEGEFKLTETVAIMRYLGRKYNLVGQNERDKISIDLIEHVVHDFRSQIGAQIYGEKFGEEQKRHLTDKLIPDQLNQLSAFFAKDNRHFVSGNSVSYVDFYLYEQLVRVSRIAPRVWEKYENLIQYFTRIEQLPKVKDYIEGQEVAPLFSHLAKWNDFY